jgi:hypothetical protein
MSLPTCPKCGETDIDDVFGELGPGFEDEAWEKLQAEGEELELIDQLALEAQP